MPRGPELAVMPRPRASRWAVLPSLWEAECWTSLTALTYSCSTPPSLIVVKGWASTYGTDTQTKATKEKDVCELQLEQHLKNIENQADTTSEISYKSPQVDCQVKAGQGTSAKRGPEGEEEKTTQSLNLWHKLEQQ